MYEDGPVPVAGMLDRRDVCRSDVPVYRGGLVVGGTMMSTKGRSACKACPVDVGNLAELRYQTSSPVYFLQ